MEDISVVKEELAEKQQALEALQRNFDDFQESSRELEEELEAELGRVSRVRLVRSVWVFWFAHRRNGARRGLQTNILLCCCAADCCAPR